MPTVYITSKIPKIASDLLINSGFKVDINNSGQNLTKIQLKDVLSKYDGILTLMTDKIDEDVLNSTSPKLKIIANFAVGFDNIDVLSAKRRGIVVTNTPGVAGESIAEHTFALILACAKQIVAADRYTRSGKYRKWDPLGFLTLTITGKTIGIIGLGRAGTFVAHVAYEGFKMNILYFDISRSEDLEILTRAKFTTLDFLLKHPDIVTLHIPLTPKTHHLIGKEQLGLMKNRAILINTARGAVVDEEALIFALKNQQIAAAGLDVFEHEPNISQELKMFDNVVLTPHMASATFECREAMARIAAENIIDVFEGRTPLGVIKLA